MSERVRIQRRTGLEQERRAQGGAATRPPAGAVREALAAPLGGEAMDGAARAFLEPRFGHSFADVRVHADAKADHLARAMEAVAFTSGRDIYFRDGAYAPGTAGGLRLLAHEATHTLQQAAGPVAGEPGPDGVAVSDPSDSFEQAAEHAADAALASSSPATAPALAAGPEPGPAVQRYMVMPGMEDGGSSLDLGGALGGGISALGSLFGGGVSAAGSLLGSAASSEGSLLGGALSGAGSAAGSVISGVGSLLGGDMAGIAGAVGGGVSDAAGAAGGIFGGLGGMAGDTISGVASGVGGAISGAAADAGGFVSGLGLPSINPEDLLM
jgi:hypothetical protein